MKPPRALADEAPRKCNRVATLNRHAIAHTFVQPDSAPVEDIDRWQDFERDPSVLTCYHASMLS